nr:urea transporter [Paenibacillus sp. IHBB 10380]
MIENAISGFIILVAIAINNIWLGINKKTIYGFIRTDNRRCHSDGR